MNFKHVYLFLVLSGTFIGKFILNINNEHELLRSVHMEKSYLGKAGYRVLNNGWFRLSKLPRDDEILM